MTRAAKLVCLRLCCFGVFAFFGSWGLQSVFSVTRSETLQAAVRPSAAKSDKPSQAAQELAWKVLLDFEKQADGDSNRPDTGVFGADGDQSEQWVPACRIRKTCSSPTTKVLRQELSPHFTAMDKGGSGSGGLGGVAGGLLLQWSSFVLYKASSASEAMNRCNFSDVSPCSNGLQLPAGSMIGRLTWANIPATGCPSISNLFGPGSSPSNQGVVQTSSAPCTSQELGGSTAVPLSSFFHVKVSRGNIKMFTVNGEPDFQPDTIAVLLGFHLMQKQSNDTWEWSTYWWLNDPEQSKSQWPVPAGFPCQTSKLGCIGGKQSAWSHYVMNTTGAPVGEDGFVGISNPFVDRSPNVQINCIVCHSYAMSPMSKSAQTSPACGGQPSTGLTTTGLTAAFRKYQSQGCKNPRHPTDMIWTLATFESLSAAQEAAVSAASQGCTVQCAQSPASNLKKTVEKPQ